MSTATGPLSDAEVQLLNDFLLSASEPDDALAIDELHGYLTPVVCCPEAVMPTDWLVGVWRAEGEGPQFESVEQAQEIMGLIMRMHNDIADALRVGEELAPLLMEVTLESGENCFVADGWCRGFMEGVRLQ